MIGALGTVPIAGIMVQRDSAAAWQAWALAPIRVSINGVSWAQWVQVDTLGIDDTLGQTMQCRMRILNPVVVPRVGDVVMATYFAEVLFAGLITERKPSPNTDLSVILYECDCTDWSILLSRRRIRRNFVNTGLVNVVDSLLDNELAGDGLSLGTVDSGSLLPLVDVRNAKAFDVLRDVAGATGQVMFVDHARVIQFRSTTTDPAPKVINYSVVEASSLVEDLQTYRNVQSVIVTGTVNGGTALSVSVKKQNDDQIAERKAIEGGTGIYEDIEEITHPTSNVTGDLQLLGLSYARLRLATSGTPRQTLRVRVRGYGFRAGQTATVDLPALSVSGSWIIQRCTLAEQAGQFLLYNLELTQSSRQQRGYEAWLNIVRAGKITVQVPSATTSNLQSFITPGTFTWTVPAGVTQAEFTSIGGSGGGGGSSPGFSGISGCQWTGVRGGNGGSGGFSVVTVPVTAGQVYTIIVGAAGAAGAEGSLFHVDPFGASGRCFGYPADPTSGASATVTQVRIGATVYGQADGGGGGLYTTNAGFNGVDGAQGSGIGDAVTSGGGRAGGVGGVNGTAPTPGADGLIEVRW